MLALTETVSFPNVFTAFLPVAYGTAFEKLKKSITIPSAIDLIPCASFSSPHGDFPYFFWPLKPAIFLLLF